MQDNRTGQQIAEEVYQVRNKFMEVQCCIYGNCSTFEQLRTMQSCPHGLLACAALRKMQKPPLPVLQPGQCRKFIADML